MNQILYFTAFCMIIAASIAEKRYINGVPVIINEYQYDITTHHTPLKIKPVIVPHPHPYPYPDEIPIQPHTVYGVPNAIDVIEPPQQPHDSYGVPLPEPVEVTINPNDCGNVLIPAEPTLKQTHPVVTEYKYEIPPSVIPSKPVEPALVYGVPTLLPEKPEPVEVSINPTDCGNILIPAKPTLKKTHPVVSEYKYELPPPIIPSKPEEPALVYGVPNLLPGKPAAVYGVPNELPVVEIN